MVPRKFPHSPSVQDLASLLLSLATNILKIKQHSRQSGALLWIQRCQRIVRICSLVSVCQLTSPTNNF